MKKYETPEFDLTIFSSSDIITTSTVIVDDGTQEIVDDVFVIK